MKDTSLLALLALSACAPSLPPVDASRPPFPALAFFTGASSGDGRLKVLFRPTVRVRVRSVGRLRPDGSLLLEQDIVEGDKPSRRRAWRMREVAPGRYAGSLSDADGPIEGVATPDRLRLSFRMKNGLSVTQWLTLRPGGRVADNRLVVSKFGIQVARLDEVISKRD